MRSKWQRILSITVVLTMIVTAMTFVTPISALADTNRYSIEIIIKTRDVTDAGTNGPVYASIGYEDVNGNRQYAEEKDFAPDGFATGQTSGHTVLYTGFSPWMIRSIRFHQKGGTAWAPESIQLKIESLAGNTFFTDTQFFPREFWLYKGEYAEATFDANTIKRVTGAHGGFDRWDEVQYIGEDTRGTETLTWDGNVTDNRYSNYNVRYSDKMPVLTMSTSNSAINAANFIPISEGQAASFSYDRAELYKQMVANNLGRVDFNFSLKYDNRSTRDVLNHSRTITVYRRCFNLGGEDITSSNTFSELVTGSSESNFYFNNEKKEVKIKLQPQTMHMEGLTAEAKTNLAKFMFCEANLYSGNNTTGDKLLCDMTKTVSNGTLTFTGTVPDNVDSLSDGVNLVLTGLYALQGAEVPAKYILDNGTGTFQCYFSKYKVDTKSPTISVVDVTGKSYAIDNAYRKAQKFWMTSDEFLFRDGGNPRSQNLFTYEIYKKNANGTYANSPSYITNSGGSGKVTTAEGPISKSVLVNTPINLNLAEADEGVYKLKILAGDKANNRITNSEIQGVILDNKPPEVSVDITNLNQAIDASKSVSCKFTINDLANSNRDKGAWARVYYCFVKNGEKPPVIDEAEIKSGEIDSVIGKWAFFEGGSTANTAQLKIQKGEIFDGKLYYYGKDSCTNTTDTVNSNISIRNEEANDTIIYTSSSYAKSAYNIKFDTSNKDITTKYYWTSKDAKVPFSQNPKDYVVSDDVGSASHIDKDGTTKLFDGTYTLHYTTKSALSGNSKTFELDFLFDNAVPTVSFEWKTKNTSPLETQQPSIKIKDVSGIEKATYQIVNLDGTPIDTMVETPLLIGANFDVSATPELKMENSGIYKIKIYAKDKNGSEYSGVVSGSEFAIRSEKATITALTDNIAIKINDKSITNTSSYKLSVSVSENMKNAELCTKAQTVKYRISADGTKYGQWMDSGKTLSASNNVLSTNFEIDTPLVLKGGTNKIYVQTVITDLDSITEPTEAYASIAKANEIVYDAVAPTYNVTYSNTGHTKDNVKVTISIADEITGMYNATFAIKNNAMAFTKISDSVYELNFVTSNECIAVVTDCVGNTVEIPISVWNIDNDPPRIEAIAQEVVDGDRKDADIKIYLYDVVNSTVKFGLLSEGMAIENSYAEFEKATGFSVEKVKSTAGEFPGETDEEYVIHARGLTGSYNIVVYAKDSLDNVLEQTPEMAGFTLTDVASKITTATCLPTITTSTTTATVKFNTTIAVLPENLATGATDEENLALAKENSSKIFSDTCVVQCASAAEKKIYGVDKCGRAYAFTFTPDAQFIKGYEIKYQFLKNDVEFDPKNATAFTADDTIKLVISQNPQYVQEFMTEGAQYVGFTLDETQSVKNENVTNTLNAEPVAENKAVTYSKLVFLANHDGTDSRFVKFKSYTNAGLEKDRIQNEYIEISSLDETKPEISATYSTLAPTKDNVVATVIFGDTKTGISKVETKDENGEYAETTATSPLKITFGENAKKYVRVTNGVGMQSVLELAVSNIDKVAVTEGTHYTLKYFSQDYLGVWNEVQAGKYYNKVKAVITPIEGSGKTLKITNNSGSFEKVLDSKANQFTFEISDAIGNTSTAKAQYSLFDNEKGTTTWRLSTTQKTNQPVTAFVTITDSVSGVGHCVVTDSEGNPYQWETEVIGNEKSVKLPKSDIYTVTAYDNAGNMWTQNITVSNINTQAPQIVREKISYSTPPGIVTAKSVNVTIGEFTKENVVITKVEPSEPLKESDIMYVNGDRSVRFKKNGTVSLTFVDEYGNVGMGILSVGNIYTAAPTLKPILSVSEDVLSVNVTFEQERDNNGMPYDIYRELKDLYVTYAGNTVTADKASFTMKSNGEYKFMVFDAAGTTQNIKIVINQIDQNAPVITGVNVTYDYYSQNPNSEWVLKAEAQTIIPKGEAGYVIANDKYQGTNQDVKVEVETDKPTKFFGSQDTYSNSASMIYSENGLFNFNMQAKNGTSVSYGVDIELIDKKAPIIEFSSTPELIFIEGMTESQDPDYTYNISKFYDYKAYDIKNGGKVDLTDKVKLDFGTFDPNNIANNKFDRTSPYYVFYKVYDDVGNCTTVRRTVRLIGYYDTIALINGSMPDSSNTASVSGNTVDISLKNFGGLAYARYESGIWTMGQMKTKGTKMVQRNGNYTLSNLSEGWYTVYIQTDKRDYFTIWVYVRPEA